MVISVHKGTRLEREIVHEYRDKGAILSVRTAGSHSFADVIVIVGDRLLLFQCKNIKKGKYSTREEAEKMFPEIPKTLTVEKILVEKVNFNKKIRQVQTLL